MSAGIVCNSGFYSQTGAQICTMCQAGYKCDTDTAYPGVVTTATAYENNSNKCGGYNCMVYVEQTGSKPYRYDKVACAAGHYCPEDSLHMIPCPRGTYMNAGGTPKTVGECTAAPAGKYADREGMWLDQLHNNLCSAGYKCPLGSRDKFAVPC